MQQEGSLTSNKAGQIKRSPDARLTMVSVAGNPGCQPDMMGFIPYVFQRLVFPTVWMCGGGELALLVENQRE